MVNFNDSRIAHRSHEHPPHPPFHLRQAYGGQVGHPLPLGGGEGRGVGAVHGSVNLSGKPQDARKFDTMKVVPPKKAQTNAPEAFSSSSSKPSRPVEDEDE